MSGLHKAVEPFSGAADRANQQHNARSADLQQLLGAIHGHQEAMDEFARVMSGVLSPADFLRRADVEHLLALRVP